MQTLSHEHLHDTEGSGKITVKLSSLSMSTPESQDESIPKWLQSLPLEYETPFRLDSALDYRVLHADHPRLQDQFTTADSRLYGEIRHMVQKEVNWEGLRTLWN
jgi:hypothetical protein